MKINFRGTRIPIETDTFVWGEKIPYTDIVVKNDKNGLTDKSQNSETRSSSCTINN